MIFYCCCCFLFLLSLFACSFYYFLRTVWLCHCFCFVLFCFVRLFVFLLIHSISFVNNNLQDLKVKNIGTERVVEFYFKNVYLSG